jgi:putative ABC transport system ATP-binding protein
MPRSLKLFRTRHHAPLAWRCPPGPAGFPSFLRASFMQTMNIQTMNHQRVRTIREQRHSAKPRPVLQTEHLSRIVAATRLVDDVSLSVGEGEVLAVIGPSGAGKSSFLRLLNRLDEPTKGTVYLASQDYRQIPPRELRRRVGLVTQMPFLFPGAIADNLRFGPRQRGEELPEETIALLLEQVGLADRAKNDTVSLSGGEAQRVSLARALANSPTVLLLDEPTSALDDEAKAEVEALLVQVVRQNRLTCVMVSHDRAQAARLADRVMLLKGGRLEKIGPVREILCGTDSLH